MWFVTATGGLPLASRKTAVSLDLVAVLGG